MAIEEKLASLRLDTRVTRVSDNWSSIIGNLNIAQPIDTRDIPHFEKWINWNRFADDHGGIDLAVYLNSFGECVLGLPPKIPIYAIEDGIVVAINKKKVMEGVVNPYDNYFDTMLVVHGASEDKGVKLVGCYAHVSPKVKEGDFVRKGQRIGRLYVDHSAFDSGRLVHLHFGLYDYDGRLNPVNPENLFPWANDLVANPQREPNFIVPELKGGTDVRLGNFGALMYGYASLEKLIPGQEFSAPKPTYSLIRRLKELL